MLAGIPFLFAQEEAPPKWDVEIPGPVAGGPAPEPVLEPEPTDFTDLTSRTKQVEMVKPPELPGLPPVEGTVNVTVKLVEAPSPPPPPPPPPLEALPPDDPEVVARLEELGEEYQGTDLVFISCEVHDHRRSLVTIYPSGRTGSEVVAWSNIDFNHFVGLTTYRVKNGLDGSIHDIGLLMGIGNLGNEDESQEIPEMSDLENGGPAFVVVNGSADSPAMATLEQLHALYRKEGARLAEDNAARQQALAQRKAELLANPPKPSDVTIRFWRKPKPEASTQPEVPSP